MKALLLDTDQSGLLQDVLRERGHDVVVCTGAGEAYDAFRRLAPPLMVLEWGLEGSGERLCKRIRPLPHGDEVVVLALLATDRPGLPTEVLEQGADDYLILPLSADTLRARLVIAERKVSALQRRRRLVESARQMEKAVETMQLGVTITDTEGTIVYANDAEASMHGRARDELLGQDVRLLAPTDLWKPRPSAEKLKAMKRWSRDSLNLRSDGSVFPVRLLSDVVTDDEGRLLGVVTTCEDCSERRNAQEALRKSEERYRTLVETAGDIVCTVSAEGFITSLNTAFQALTDWRRLSPPCCAAKPSLPRSCACGRARASTLPSNSTPRRCWRSSGSPRFSSSPATSPRASWRRRSSSPTRRKFGAARKCSSRSRARSPTRLRWRRRRRGCSSPSARGWAGESGSSGSAPCTSRSFAAPAHGAIRSSTWLLSRPPRARR